MGKGGGVIEEMGEERFGDFIKGLFHLAAPWTWVYEIFTNGYFVAWIVYEWVIRKKYFRMEVYSKPAQIKPETDHVIQ